jgi:steroid delta-isomerase-like uncharacterized protein
MSATASSLPITLEWIRPFAERYLGAWNDHDAGALLPLLTEDIVYFDPALPEPARGHAGVRKFMEDTFAAFPDLRFEEAGPVCIAPDAPTVMLPWRMLGTHRGPLDPPGFAATNRSVDVLGIDVWEIRDGLVARYWAYYDAMVIARQIGAVPQPGTIGERATVMLQRLQAAALRRRR